MHKARFLSKLFLVFLSVIGASHRSVYGSEIKEDKYIYLPITDGQIRSAPMFFLKCDLLNDFTAVSIHPNLSFPSLKKVRLGDGIKVPGKEMGHFRVVSNTTFEVDMDGKKGKFYEIEFRFRVDRQAAIGAQLFDIFGLPANERFYIKTMIMQSPIIWIK